MTPPGFMAIAHRGASSYAPENTCASFDLAIAMVARHIELDVHFSSDGHLVVIHDDGPYSARRTNKDSARRVFPFREFRERIFLRAGHNFSGLIHDKDVCDSISERLGLGSAQRQLGHPICGPSV